MDRGIFQQICKYIDILVLSEYGCILHLASIVIIIVLLLRFILQIFVAYVKEMRKGGIPVCDVCGYPVKHWTTSSCPECGTNKKQNSLRRLNSLRVLGDKYRYSIAIIILTSIIIIGAALPALREENIKYKYDYAYTATEVNTILKRMLPHWYLWIYNRVNAVECHNLLEYNQLDKLNHLESVRMYSYLEVEQIPVLYELSRTGVKVYIFDVCITSEMADQIELQEGKGSENVNVVYSIVDEKDIERIGSAIMTVQEYVKDIKK